MVDGKPPLRVPLDALQPGPRRLQGEALHYVTRVHRCKAGDRLLAFDPVAQLEAPGVLRSVESSVALVDLEQPRQAERVPAARVTLVYALAKGDKVDQVVRDGTALGVTRLVLTCAERSVVRLDAERSASKRRRWQTIAVESARQCGRGDLPELEGPWPFEEALRAGVTPGGTALCLAADAERPLSSALRAWNASTELTLLVGPEGGFSEAEIRAARAAGYQTTCLGPFVLRTETAAVAVLGAVAAWVGSSFAAAADPL